MAQVTLVFGIVLVLLGVGSYLGSQMASVTALIPAFLGLPILLLGVVMRDPDRAKHAGHGAAVLALLGLVGSSRGIGPFFEMLGGGQVERPAAVTVQTMMALACVVFLALAVKSFRDVRRARTTQS